MRWRFVRQSADHALAADADQQRLAECVKQRQGVQQRQVFPNRLAEADAGIEDDVFTQNTCGKRGIAAIAESRKLVG